MAGYSRLPVPPAYQGSSGEKGQIQLDGIATKVEVFHGRVDDEADWHVFINPDDDDWPVEMYCEVMVLDDYSKPTFGDDKFYSADFTLPFRLVKPGSAHPAWDLGKEAIDSQGHSLDCSQYSRLVEHAGRVYLQGPYVNDEAHDTRVEIHPLDSIAFAIDSSSQTISARPGDADWPSDFVRWRVAAFANSSLHRINDENFVQRRRTTTWFLDPPGRPPTSRRRPVFDAEIFTTLEVDEEPRALWNGDTEAMYAERRVAAISPPQFSEDPRDGRTKVRVSITMEEPDSHGGIVVRDYLIRRVPGQVVAQI